MARELGVPEEFAGRPVNPDDREQEPLESVLIRAAFHGKKLALQSKVGYIQKDKKNKFHGYGYVSAEAILKAINAAMLETRITARPTFQITSEKWLEREGKSPQHIVTVECYLHLTDEQTGYGETAANAYGCGEDTGDKAVMKAQTAALKYAWMCALSIPTGDDPEADASTDERANAVTENKIDSKGISTRTYTPTRQASAPAAASVSADVPPPAVSVSSSCDCGPDIHTCGKQATAETADAPLPAAWKPPEKPPEAPVGRAMNRAQGRIVDFKIESGVFKAGPNKGQEWHRYDVTLDDKLRYSTFSSTVGDKASMLAAGGDPVVVFWVPDKSGKYRNMEEIDTP